MWKSLITEEIFETQEDATDDMFENYETVIIQEMAEQYTQSELLKMLWDVATGAIASDKIVNQLNEKYEEAVEDFFNDSYIEIESEDSNE